MTRANTPELVGEVCLVDQDYPNLMLCDKTLRLVPRSNVEPHLLSEMLQSPSVRQQLQSVATGTGRSMKNISQAKIGELRIAYPQDENATTTTNERVLGCREAIRNARKPIRQVPHTREGYVGDPAACGEVAMTFNQSNTEIRACLAVAADRVRRLASVGGG